ncbi:MAG: S-methyl-5-thioribose-1-phosphate isomerase, partial [Cycloclasticus sp.]
MIDNEIVLYDSIRPVRWQADGLYLLDQRKLPDEEVYLHIVSTQALYQAIKEMVVRGAPAIGIAAAYGAVIAATESKQAGRQDFQARLDLLASSRPTAVNLFNALKAAQRIAADSADPISSLLSWAHTWLEDDIKANKTIGAYGARCFAAGSRVLTHCNAGAL